MTDDPVRAAIAGLIEAAREAAEFLARAGGADGETLGKSLWLGLGGVAPLIKQLDDAEAVPAFVDTLMAVVAVARRTALPALTGDDRAALEAALKAADELLAGWTAPIAAPAASSTAEILPFRPRGR